MANTNFLQFDSQSTNMLSDENYSIDSQRISGVSEGLARSALYNKQSFQSSTMIKALADFIVDCGYDAMDNNLTALTNTLKSLLATKTGDNTFTGDNSFSGSVSFSDTTTKSNITSLSMPDYSSGVAKTVGTEYTAETNGFILVKLIRSMYGSVYIDGVDVTGSLVSDSNLFALAIMYPIEKGHTYQVNWVYAVTFYPCVGG